MSYIMKIEVLVVVIFGHPPVSDGNLFFSSGDREAGLLGLFSAHLPIVDTGTISYATSSYAFGTFRIFVFISPPPTTYYILHIPHLTHWEHFGIFIDMYHIVRLFFNLLAYNRFRARTISYLSEIRLRLAFPNLSCDYLI